MATEEKQLEIGDVVQLKSGGAKMTVVTAGALAAITCRFFDGQGEADEMTVPRNALKKVSITSTKKK